MTHNSSVAANLKPEQRKKLFLEMQSSDQTITALQPHSRSARPPEINYFYKCSLSLGNWYYEELLRFIFELGVNETREECQLRALQKGDLAVLKAMGFGSKTPEVPDNYWQERIEEELRILEEYTCSKESLGISRDHKDFTIEKRIPGIIDQIWSTLKNIPENTSHESPRSIFSLLSLLSLMGFMGGSDSLKSPVT